MEVDLQGFTRSFLAHCILRMQMREPGPSVILAELAQLRILFAKDPMFGSFFVAAFAATVAVIAMSAS